MKKRANKKRQGLTLNIRLTNRWLYTLIVIGILAVLGVGVYALLPGEVPNPGHSINEVGPPSACSPDQYLKFDGTNWVCDTVSFTYTETDPTVRSWAKTDNPNIPGKLLASDGRTKLYKITNSRCTSAGAIVIESQCTTRFCSGERYYNCDGSCGGTGLKYCPNTWLGSLV